MKTTDENMMMLKIMQQYKQLNKQNPKDNHDCYFLMLLITRNEVVQSM